MRISNSDEYSQIIFHTESCKKLFFIQLVDFLTNSDGFKVYGTDKPVFPSLQEVPFLWDNSQIIKKTVDKFVFWLDEAVQFEHHGETHELYFPSIEQSMPLKISRKEAISICGNLLKHNYYTLSGQAKTIQKNFKDNNIQIEITDAFLIFSEFYEKFYNGILHYHLSTIVEFLNNIRWSIFHCLKPVREHMQEYYFDEKLQMQMKKYNFPIEINSNFVNNIYYELMNMVEHEPYFPKFQTASFFKLLY